jgi:ATP-dependent RNA helicase DDX56/DBP9
LKGKGLFFVNSTDGGYRLKLFLEQFHIRSSVLNAELPLLSRMSIIDQFNAGNFDYLIATDESSTMMKKIPTISASREDDDEHYDNGEKYEGEQPVKAQKSSKVSKITKDEHYGVSRGVDFQGVSFVVNVDLPLSADSYTHRIGRTARGSSKGVALSLVERESEEQRHALTLIQASQPPISLATAAGAASSTDGALTPATTNTAAEETYANPPLPLDFDLKEIEGFRYRVEDVRRAVTSIAVKEVRAAELKAELLNSESLQSHFALNPADLQLLRHDRQATHVTRIQDHLKWVLLLLCRRYFFFLDNKLYFCLIYMALDCFFFFSFIDPFFFASIDMFPSTYFLVVCK